MTGYDIEGALADIGTEAPSTETQPVQESAPVQQPPVQQPEYFELKYNNKTVKGDRNQFTQWAQQGYDYAQKMERFNSEQAAWNAQKAQHEAQWQKYKQIDEYARQNPAWAEYLDTSWNQRNAQAQTQQPFDVSSIRQQVLQELQGEIAPVKAWFEEQRIKEQDTALQKEIDTIQAKYPDLDLSLVDQSGKTLERRVMEFAQQTGIPTFTAAFQAYTYDQRAQSAEAKGREALAKEQDKQRRAGLLGQAPTTQQQPFDPRLDRKRSYSDIAEDEARRLGLT